MAAYTKGAYRVRILDQVFESAATGSERFSLHVKVLGRYDASGQLQACTQNQRTYRQSLMNETGASLLKADLKAIGVDLTDLTQLVPGEPGFADLTGKQIDMVCDLEFFEGREMERWRIQRNKPLTLESVRALQAKFGQLLKGDGHQGQAASAAENEDEAAA